MKWISNELNVADVWREKKYSVVLFFIPIDELNISSDPNLQ